MNKIELREYIKTRLNGCSGYVFIDRALDDLFEEINKQETFDCDKFVEWFKDRNVTYLSSPIAFLNKCGREDVRNGAFSLQLDSKKYRNATQLLRPLGFTIDKPTDTLMIELIEERAFKDVFKDIDKLEAFKDKIINYCIKNKITTSTHYIACLKNSKALKKTLNWEQIKTTFELRTLEWEKVIKEL